MPTQLNDASGRIDNTFQLVGRNEDALTRGIAWVLRSCPTLLSAVMERVLGTGTGIERARLTIHRHERGRGITDLEIETDAAHVIVEAKLGWTLPSLEQLRLYRARDCRQGAQRALVTLSECGSHSAKVRLPKELDGVRVVHIGWQELAVLARNVATRVSNVEKRLLRELADHLEESMTRRRDSSLVYVVALSGELIEGSKLTWMDVVVKHGRYFHPVGAGYPPEPVNNIAFRYDGQLQAVHHVDSYEVVEDLALACKGIPSRPDRAHFVYTLGPRIAPPPIKAGPRVPRSNRVWCAFDTLFTSKTLSDAVTETQRRQSTGDAATVA